MEAWEVESNTKEHKEQETIKEKTKQMLQKPHKSTRETKAIQLSTMAIAQANERRVTRTTATKQSIKYPRTR